MHLNAEPPFPELLLCPWCGRENFRHDITKHINPSLGEPTTEKESTDQAASGSGGSGSGTGG